ncbi:DUF6308 family protein [Janibacter cremeus]|uniref:DUF6308 family protein n=1 Tax=Janibacter cremeus TaxID=1285192 RepID=UPI0023F7D38B|nr:DUF6308 family protein [Janibacter cremeus]WEV78809.1 DUF6308 family protein [Janibacter cremeus]
MTNSVSVGRATIPMKPALDWIQAYTNRVHVDSKKPYAYWAYDALDTGAGQDKFNDGDLLVPLLLNAAPTVAAFYRLRAMAPDLEIALEAFPDRPIVDLSNSDIEARVAPLYAVLDEDHRHFRGHGVQGTTLSKVLHRKRPHSLPLHDKWVHRCYVGSGRPIVKERGRSWAALMTLLSQEMAADIRRQPVQFEQLRRASSHSEISDLRLLDILAWTSRGKSQA